METIDTALQRLFYVRMRHGEFDPAGTVPYQDPLKYGPDAFDTEYYSAVSREAAQQSITLLKNNKGLLPLDAIAKKKVAMFGCLVREKREGLGGRIYSDCQVCACARVSVHARMSETVSLHIRLPPQQDTTVGPVITLTTAPSLPRPQPRPKKPCALWDSTHLSSTPQTPRPSRTLPLPPTQL